MPNRVLMSLLRWLSNRDAANAVAGDALEELTELTGAGKRPSFPNLWINGQIARAIGTATAVAVPRLIRTLSLVARDAVRALHVAPSHSVLVILVLAAGATLATLTYSVVDAVMLRPLPVDHPEQLVTISTMTIEPQPLRGRSIVKHFITPDVFWRIHDTVQTVQPVVARSDLRGAMMTVGDVRAEGTITSGTGDLFALLRLSPSMGRLWTADDLSHGRMDVAVLGYRFWHDRLAADPSILGKTVTIAGWIRDSTYTVIGVLSAASDHPEVNLTTSEVWIPFALPHTANENYHFSIDARLRPGVSRAQVAEEVARITGVPGWKPDVKSILEGSVEQFRGWMILALGASALVMLVACANAANLMLTRSVTRAQEMAVRASLGASRQHIAISVLVEGLLLSSGATLAAIILCIPAVRAARLAVLKAVPWMYRASTIAVNDRVLFAALAGAVLTGLISSVVPAWQTSRMSVLTVLKNSANSTSTGRRLWRSVFLTAEVAIVVVLLTISWLFVTSLVRVNQVDVGIDPHRLLAVSPRMPFRTTVDDVRRRAGRVDGVADVAVSTGASTPLVGSAFGGAWKTTTVQRTDTAAPSPIDVVEYYVTRNYFQVAGIRFIRGGTWRSDFVDATTAVVLDEHAVQRLFNNEEALGRQLRTMDPDGVHPDGIFTIVGIVPHIYTRGPEAVTPPVAFFPLQPNADRKFASLLLKTSKPPERVLPLVNEALQPAAPNLDEPFVFAADQAMARITAVRRFNAQMMSLFGLVGMLIGAAGVYAVMAAFVAQQTREIGVRVALGAGSPRIQLGVLAAASRHLLAGLALGAPVAWWLSRAFTALLFQITPAEPSAYLGVAALLSGVGVVAAWGPARRAARVDPIVALRAE